MTSTTNSPAPQSSSVVAVMGSTIAAERDERGKGRSSFACVPDCGQGAAHMAVVHAEQAVALSRSLQQRQAGCLPLLSLRAAAPGPVCTCKSPMLDVNNGVETVYTMWQPDRQSRLCPPPTACSSNARVTDVHK